MSRRNPLNERYGKHTAPAGKTRKSAASAKPKRSTGAASGSAKKPASAASKKRASLVIHPKTPEYKRFRTIWWVLLGGAVVLSTLAWWLWRDPSQRALGNVVLAAGYAMIFGAIFIDWAKLRPMRTQWAKKQGGQSGKEEKADGAAEKKAAGKSDES